MEGACDSWLSCTRGTHNPPPTPYNDLSSQATDMRIEVRYQTPYGDCQWRSQWFNTLAEAERMVEFYRSCGSPSHIAPSSLAQFAHLR